jgi:hypothetical protein
MSKFIDRLQKVFQPVPQSMGFKASIAEQTKPKIQLILRVVDDVSQSLPKEHNHVDAWILSEFEVRADKAVWGTWFSMGSEKEVEKSIKSGADFVILPVSGEVLPPDKKIGKIIRIEASTTDVLLRAASELPVDAFLLSENEQDGLSLTWKRLMLIERFTSLLNKPLLIEVLADINETQLQQVWEAGVSGVIVTINVTQAEAVSRNLRQIINKLSFPSKRKREKSLALIPRIERKQEEPEEDEEDDD